ncbi:choline transporter-like protein 5-B isoform X2 [Melanotaenia boesemani]|uniref:choline transporter-like protein 5-B isoform X2 n=1 Tax=Melanotaenia boesemani TaxID=1250792 RepID=UPI001C0465FA|nr:choline transporter-like protein 5-B isoform X2 [Melanotaenia boesemani]
MARISDIPTSYYGEPRRFDPNFRGPVQNRSCTDVVCCVIFVIVILGYIVLGTVAWIHGDPRKIVYPTDSQGQFCGQQNTSNANKAILFYFNMLKCANPAVLINLQCPTTQLCVSKCPDRFATFLDARNTQNWKYYKQFCKPGFEIGSKSVAEVIRDEDCPSMIVPSRPFLQRCFPDFIRRDGILTVANQTIFKDGDNNKRSVNDLRDAAKSIASLLNAKEVGMKIFEDYANSWIWILIGLVISMVVSLLFILLLRYTAGMIVWLIICGVIAAVSYGIWYCYGEYNILSKKTDANVTISEIGFHTDFSIYLQHSQMWLIFMISLCVIDALVLIILIFLRSRLKIAIALLKEGSRAISYIMSTLFYPLVTFFLLAICIAYSTVTAVFLASSGNAVYKVAPTDDQCMYANLTCNPKTFSQTNVTKACPGSQCMFAFYGGESVYHHYILVLHLCNLFVFLWLVNFILALGQCTLAGAFASYYWALKKPKDIPDCPLYSSFSRAIRYHTGSLAFGSLILALAQMVRIVLEYLDHKLKGSQNACARFLICCLKCCFWCLEHVIKFINRNAYIMIAIYGRNFCTSSKDAFFLLMRNVVRVAVLDKVTDFLLFLGKLLVSGGVGALAFFFFSQKIPGFKEEVPSLNYSWVPLVTVSFGAYMIANGFFNIYAMCVDTLFLCFCEDLERNDGSSSRPYYMSPGLHKILRKGEERAKSCASS